MKRSGRKVGPEVCIHVPATSANLGPGFDCLGLALDITNEVRVAEADRTVVRVTGQGVGRIASDTSNLVYRSARRLYEAIGRPMPPLLLEMHNRIPPSRGLGSSSAAIVAGLVGANILAGRPFEAGALLNLATAIEGHPDNVAPALLGGVVVAVGDGEGPVQALRLEPPEGLRVALFIPEVELSTHRARAALPEAVPRRDAVFNVGRAALLAASLATGALDGLPLATEDRLHQPYRAPLLPHLEPLLAAAKEAGALGAFLSGAGPTVAAFVREAEPVLMAWEATARRLELGGRARVAEISSAGARIG